MDDARNEAKRIYVLLRFIAGCRQEGISPGCDVELAMRDWAAGRDLDVGPPERPTPGNADARRRAVASTLAAAREADLILPLPLVAVLVAWCSLDPER